MQPLLRRLLLARLAARSANAKTSWARVHLWLRWRARKDRDSVTALYHTLALAGTDPVELAKVVDPSDQLKLEIEQPFEHVARQLARWLRSADAAHWLRLVAGIAAAPTRLDPARRVRDQVVEVTRWVDRHEEPTAPVARYLAYCWLGADPLRAPSWSWLLGEMASDLDQLAPYSGDGGLSVLRAEAERYRYLADGDWQDIENFWVNRQRSSDEFPTEPGSGQWQLSAERIPTVTFTIQKTPSESGSGPAKDGRRSPE
jgi:hypothetical protein